MTVDELERTGLDAVDRRILVATQVGCRSCRVPTTPSPKRLGLAPEDVMQRMRRLLDRGVIRRIGAVPNHYALGYRANGMTVWDVDDARVDELGARVGALAFVTHCYRRPRVLPDWPYNLFAMVHGRRGRSGRAGGDDRGAPRARPRARRRPVQHAHPEEDRDAARRGERCSA